MVYCAVYGCKASNKKNFKRIAFHRFPANDKELEKLWIDLCGRKDKFNPKGSRICEKHFSSEQKAFILKHELFNYSAKNARLLKPDAIPDRNLPLKKKCDIYFQPDEKTQKQDCEKTMLELLFSDKENEISESDVSENEMTEKEISDNEISEIEIARCDVRSQYQRAEESTQKLENPNSREHEEEPLYEPYVFVRDDEIELESEEDSIVCADRNDTDLHDGEISQIQFEPYNLETFKLQQQIIDLTHKNEKLTIANKKLIEEKEQLEREKEKLNEEKSNLKIQNDNMREEAEIIYQLLTRDQWYLIKNAPYESKGA